jgi:hypothetical protein
MKNLFSIIVRAAFTAVALAVIEYQIPYYFLVFGGLAAGFFMLKTSDDRELSIGILAGTILFGVYAFVRTQIYGIGG